VQTGDQIIGSMTQLVPGSWNITSQVVGGGRTTLVVHNQTQMYSASVTLEAYRISACSEYPPSGSMQFQSLALSTSADFSPYTPAWTTDTDPYWNCEPSAAYPDAKTVTLEWQSAA